MSLTSHLEDRTRTSPVQAYVSTVAGIVEGSKRGRPNAATAASILGIADRPRDLKVTPGVKSTLPGLVGSAFDYRLRFRLGPCTSDDLIAKRHASTFTGGVPFHVRAAGRFFEHLDSLLETLRPHELHLKARDDQLLARYCMTLACMEASYRSPRPMSMPISQYRTTPAMEPLLRVAPVAAAKDVVHLLRSAETAFKDQIRQVTSGDLPYVPNPTFKGSSDVGGADADLIIGDTLYELKSTKNLNPRAIRDALLQLIGYCLLDYRDAYKIRNVAVYFPRYEWVITWPLWMLVYPTDEVLERVDVSTGTHAAPSKAELRVRLKALRSGMKAAATDKWIDYAAMPGYHLPRWSQAPTTHEAWQQVRTQRRAQKRKYLAELKELAEWNKDAEVRQQSLRARNYESQRKVIRQWDSEDCG